MPPAFADEDFLKLEVSRTALDHRDCDCMQALALVLVLLAEHALGGFRAPASPHLAAARRGSRSVSLRGCAVSERAARRLKLRASKELALAMVQLQLPANSATLYADCLADAGVRSPSELCSLSKEVLDRCDVRRAHRSVLAASAVFFGNGDDVGVAAEAQEGAQAAAEGAQAAEENGGDDARETFSVEGSLEGMRVDAALASLLPPLSRTYFGSLCSEGRVEVDGARVKKSARLGAGSSLSVRLRAAEELRVDGEPIELDLLYEDASMLAACKPAGMVVHPAPGHWSGTFANALVGRIQEQRQQQEGAAGSELPDAFGDGLRPGIVHRLDRYTSGVLLGAKSADAQRALLEAFAARRTFKVYLAIVAGKPPAFTTVAEPIGRHPTDRLKMACVGEGEGRSRSALSEVHSLASDGKLSLVCVRIATGRTHQIRVHLQHMRAPVLGDPLYGDANHNRRERRRAARPLLHSYRMMLRHPATREPLTITAPAPDDLRAVGASLAGVPPEEFEAWLQPRLDAALAPALDAFEL